MKEQLILLHPFVSMTGGWKRLTKIEVLKCLLAMSMMALPANMSAAPGAGGRSQELMTSAEIKQKWAKVNGPEIIKAAEAGDPTAQYYVGMSKLEQDTPQSRRKAFEWIKKAAMQRLLVAEDRMGYFYYVGGSDEESSVTRDRLALEWFRKAAERGSESSQHQLGLLLLKGSECRPDLGEAIDWLRKAADQGCAKAQHDLARQYRCGNGEPRNADDTPVALYRRAAKKGCLHAEAALAERSFNGLGMDKDYVECVRHYRQVVVDEKFIDDSVDSHPYKRITFTDEDRDEVANAQSALVLADASEQELLRRTKAVQKFAEILKIYIKAVDKREPAAQVSIGNLYMKGDHVKVDTIEALAWYSIAAGQGYAPAIALRDELSSGMNLEQRKLAGRRAIEVLK